MEAQRELDAEHAARVKAQGELKSLKLEMEENAKLRAMLQESLQRVGRLPSSLLLAGRRALILGGGPAGLALAVSLSQRGCMVQVHERTTEEQTKSKGFGWLLMPNGVKALEALGVKKRCLREARAIESTETYVHHQEGGNKDEVEGIFSCTREDLVSGMIEVLPKGCVIRGSRVLDIETEGSAEKTTVTAVKVMAASGQESWLRLRQPNQENDFDYVFGADGVNSLLARRLNPEMSRRPGGSHNTIVTCLKDDRLAQQLGARFVKTYFHSVTKGQCCAFGLLSPAMGVVLGFMQFSTVLHGTAPYKSGKNMRADVRGFIIDVLGLPSSVTSMGGVVTHYSVKARNGSTNPTFDLAEMQTLVTPRTRMLSICNPHNPLGRAWKLRELQDLVNFAELHRLSIVSDEVWSDLVHAPRVHIPTACVSPYAAAHTYSIFGFSKSHGLEGLRIGALVAPSVEQLTKALTLSHTDTTANGASVAAQVAAITAMTEAGSHNVGWLASWRLHLRACVRHAVMRLNKMEGVHAIEPEAGFVIWANISRLLYHNIQNSNTFSNDEEPEMELMQWLIREHKVCIIPGLDRFFGPGSKGHIRLSVATSKPVLDEALDRLERGLKVWLQQRQTLLKSLSSRSTNATENTGQKAEGIRTVCVVDKDASGGSQQSKCMVVADSTRESDACRTVASSDKLTAMMRDRVQDIKSIRGVFNEKVQAKNGALFELNNKMKILRHDVDLMMTVDHLKSKNKDYAQQVSQLSLTVDELILSKNKNIKQISMLENDVAAKTIMINEITAEIHNSFLEEKTAEYAALAKQLERSNAESYGLKVALQDLESKNTTFANELEKLLAEKKSADATMANLVTSLKEAMVHHKEEVSCQNKQIRVEIHEVKRFAAQAFVNIVDAINQLEKDIDEEF
ncbi:hypothetical protein ACHAW5_003831 [Stephanodiscus triporus]|uniref:Aminotransferase class I/classII domain-containing protein n=1 Tax=Stephanodiscus triporus TaxID=2934178 RepID=A0ABD3R5D6_9STRA